MLTFQIILFATFNYGPVNTNRNIFESAYQFLSSFFYMNGVSVHMKPMNPLTAKPHLFETALPNDCLQCIMGIA